MHFNFDLILWNTVTEEQSMEKNVQKAEKFVWPAGTPDNLESKFEGLPPTC